jgi:hypothetical protein
LVLLLTGFAVVDDDPVPVSAVRRLLVTVAPGDLGLDLPQFLFGRG